jgi:hypothetical protein
MRGVTNDLNSHFATATQTIRVTERSIAPLGAPKGADGRNA